MRQSRPQDNAPRSKNNPSIVHLLSRPTFSLPILLVAVLAAALWLIFVGRGATRTTAKPTVKHNGQIATVTPHIATNRAVAAPLPKPKPIDPNARPTVVGEVVNGYVMLPSGRLHKRVGVITNTTAIRSKPWYHIFKHRCNNELATYLSLKPGEGLIGSRPYTGTFKNDFIESMKTPITVSPDDSPEMAQLKRDVNAARLQLKDAMDRGEDIEQIMIDTRNQIQDLRRVKGSIQMAFNEAAEKCETEQDVDDLISASNRLLEEQGIAPIEANGITKMNIMEEMRDRREAADDGTDTHESEARKQEKQEGTNE